MVRVLTLPPLRFGLLGQEVACGHVLVTRCVNEEVLEWASCEAIGRVLSLPPLRFGLLGEYSLDRKVYAD